MSQNITVVNKLTAFRKKQNLTQEALAEAVGVSRQTIISIEKGKFVPSVKLALQIAKEFNTPLEKIFQLEKHS
ncbi:MAG: helix-turn-helix transcriptional regulator [Candidatus Altimarinota bacterium]